MIWRNRWGGVSGLMTEGELVNDIRALLLISQVEYCGQMKMALMLGRRGV